MRTRQNARIAQLRILAKQNTIWQKKTPIVNIGVYLKV